MDRPLPPQFFASPSGPAPQGSKPVRREHSTEPPSIPRSETGTGVTVELRDAGDTPLSYREIYEKNAPSIVSIEATTS